MQQAERSSEEAQSPRIVVPSREDPLLRASTEPVGGPLGRHVIPGRQRTGFFTVERVLVMSGLMSAMVAVLFKDHCRRVGWLTPDQYSTACYSSLPNAFERFSAASSFSEAFGALNELPMAGYLGSLTAWLSGLVTDFSEGAGRTLAYFDIAVLLIVMAWLVSVLAMVWLHRCRPWDAAALAFSPFLLFAAYSGWQLWAVALALCGLLLFSRGRPGAGGLFFGAAAGIQLSVLLIPVAITVLALRPGAAQRAVRRLVTWLLAGTFGSWTALVLMTQLIAPGAFLSSWGRSVTEEPSAGSWFGVINAFASRFGLEGVSGVTASVISTALLLGGVALISWFASRSARPPRLAQLSFLLIAWALLVDRNGVPENLIVLLALLGLARPRWRLLLGWQLTVLVFYLAYLMYLGVVLGTNNTQNGIDLPYYALAMFAATAATVITGLQVIWDIVHPSSDLVGRRGPDPLWPRASNAVGTAERGAIIAHRIRMSGELG